MVKKVDECYLRFWQQLVLFLPTLKAPTACLIPTHFGYGYKNGYEIWLGIRLAEFKRTKNIPFHAVLARPDFFCNPVETESICYRTRANQLVNESNKTERLEKIGRVHAQKTADNCSSLYSEARKLASTSAIGVKKKVDFLLILFIVRNDHASTKQKCFSQLKRDAVSWGTTYVTIWFFWDQNTFCTYLYTQTR